MSKPRVFPAEPRFAYVGQSAGKHAFKVVLTGKAFPAYEFERRVAEWLLNEAEGPTATARPEPKISPETLLVLIERVVDVVRFSNAFEIDGLTLDAVAA